MTLTPVTTLLTKCWMLRLAADNDGALSVLIVLIGAESESLAKFYLPQRSEQYVLTLFGVNGESSNPCLIRASNSPEQSSLRASLCNARKDSNAPACTIRASE